ncbi:2,3-bisphosphoglycerate-dependent phosphoglycerate mutase [compost metagenome]
MSVEIFIARHGQNEDNVNGVLNGHRDLPLTDLGRQQARDLGQGIIDAGLGFDAVYSSPLSRALETAQIVSEAINLPEPVVLPELIERDFGVMTGQKANDIEKLCAPDIIKTDTITYFLNPEGAETFEDLVARGHQVLETVRSRHIGGKVLLVCHGDLGKMVYAAATEKPWKDVLLGFHFGNGELIDISDSNDARKIKLEQFNH